MFAALPSQHQMKVFISAPVGKRKVILATNIAETSITIPGVKYVIDTGFVKGKGWLKDIVAYVKGGLTVKEMLKVIIHQIFSLTRDWSKHIT